MSFDQMFLINLVNCSVEAKNAVHKGDKISYQILSNQYYIMLKQLKNDGVDVESLEKKIDVNTVFCNERQEYVYR